MDRKVFLVLLILATSCHAKPRFKRQVNGTESADVSGETPKDSGGSDDDSSPGGISSGMGQDPSEMSDGSKNDDGAASGRSGSGDDSSSDGGSPGMGENGNDSSSDGGSPGLGDSGDDSSLGGGSSGTDDGGDDSSSDGRFPGMDNGGDDSSSDGGSPGMGDSGDDGSSDGGSPGMGESGDDGDSDGGSTVSGDDTDGGWTVMGGDSDGGSTVMGGDSDGGSTVMGDDSDGGSTVSDDGSDGGSTVSGDDSSGTNDDSGSSETEDQSPSGTDSSPVENDNMGTNLYGNILSFMDSIFETAYASTYVSLSIVNSQSEERIRLLTSGRPFVAELQDRRTLVTLLVPFRHMRKGLPIAQVHYRKPSSCLLQSSTYDVKSFPPHLIQAVEYPPLGKRHSKKNRVFDIPVPWNIETFQSWSNTLKSLQFIYVYRRWHRETARYIHIDFVNTVYRGTSFSRGNVWKAYLGYANHTRSSNYPPSTQASSLRSMYQAYHGR